MMEQTKFKVDPYRWVVLVVFMFVVCINQFLWITFAPITHAAATFYGVSDFSIGLLSMIFMIVFIIVSIPASWVIDKYGIRVAVGAGALLTGVFGFLRGILPQTYSMVLFSQIMIAIGQPFILNAITTVVAKWFPVKERATASGLGSLAMYLGIFLGLILTPYLFALFGLSQMLLVYGVVAILPVFFFFIFAKEKPVTPPCPPELAVRSLEFGGLKEMLRNKNFLLLLLIFFVGLGTFNAVTTWIEEMLSPRGFSSTQAGMTGGLMIAGGIVGALVLPTLSDHYRRRVPFLITAILGAILGLVGIVYVTSFPLLLFFAFVMGFFLLSAGPIGFQYGAEITHPAPEGTSNGMLLLMGQISGILFIFGMDALKSPLNGSMTLPLDLLIVLMVLCIIVGFMLKESSALSDQK
jgi:MFS family permease